MAGAILPSEAAITAPIGFLAATRSKSMTHRRQPLPDSPLPPSGTTHTARVLAGLDAVRTRSETRCRKADSMLHGDEPQHKRQNSTGNVFEELNLDALASELLADAADETESRDASLESKTARRRAEFNSKSKNITFNQKKHLTPSYFRRLERRRNREGGIDDTSSRVESLLAAGGAPERRRVTLPFTVGNRA